MESKILLKSKILLIPDNHLPHPGTEPLQTDSVYDVNICFVLVFADFITFCDKSRIMRFIDAFMYTFLLLLIFVLSCTTRYLRNLHILYSIDSVLSGSAQILVRKMDVLHHPNITTVTHVYRIF